MESDSNTQPIPRPPPICMRNDEYSAADPARKRLNAKSRFPIFKNLRIRRSKPRTESAESNEAKKPKDDSQSEEDDASSSDAATPELGANPIINLDGSVISEEEYKDQYQWAIVYENQRGMTVFSIPYYSKLGLLPTDPSPFTVPNVSKKRSEQPDISLDQYPLPDGSWRWVSKSWMIDMRSDSGEVQYDGFEYNWMFRRHKWRAEVGSFNAGGWVRRRRWVRLMMRPAMRIRMKGDTESGDVTPELNVSRNGGSGHNSWLESRRKSRYSVGSSFPPSVLTFGSADVFDVDEGLEPDEVWKGDDVDADWARCHLLMRRLGRDGRKLEVWKQWLGQDHQSGRKTKQWTEDESLSPTDSPVETPEETNIEYITSVLRKHGDAILHLFIFPDSRAQFIELMGFAGLLPQLNVGLGMGWSASEVDFWSYASDLGSLGAQGRPSTSASDMAEVKGANWKLKGTEEDDDIWVISKHSRPDVKGKGREKAVA